MRKTCPLTDKYICTSAEWQLFTTGISGFMATTREELLRRAARYAQRHGLTLGEQLGFGVHGIVLVAKNQQNPGRSAIKIHERKSPYQRERDVYLRLREHQIHEIHGCHVPQLLRFDDVLWVIEMEVVTRPFVLDFAGAYLDEPPDYPAEVLADWRAEKQEQFGDRWPEVQAVLAVLKRYGIHMVDVSPGNISFKE